MQEEVAHQLKRIADLLSNHLSPNQDGFCEPPKSIEYVFVDAKDLNCWHTLEDSKPVEIQHKAVSGVIQQLTKLTVVSGGEEHEKLDMWLKTSTTTYVIRCGWDSNACRSLLRSLCGLSDTQLKERLTFSPYRLTDRGVQLTKTTAASAVFFDVWTPDGKVLNERTAEINSDSLYKQVQYLLTGELPSVPRTELTNQSDLLISNLGWTTQEARNYLTNHYQVRSRQHLTDEQLQNFVDSLNKLVNIAREQIA